MSDLTLIHLVSEQTLQNLLPTLALRPSALLQVRSQDARFERTAGNLEAACRAAGLHETAFLPVVTIPSDSPSIADTESVLNKIRLQHPSNPLAINVTGGTKLMSIGAHRFAEYHRLPSLYTDTQNRRAFADTGTGNWPEAIPDLSQVINQLTVPIVMAAQGKQFREDTISPEQLEFGQRAWDLRINHRESIQAWTRTVRETVPRNQAGKVQDSREKLIRFLESSIPPPQSDAAAEYLDAAAEAGLLRVDLSGRAFLRAEPTKSSVERSTNLLDGGWLELAVASFARTGTRFADVHWSVEPAQTRDPADYGETDLVLVDREELRLAIISCKSGLQHVSKLEHLTSWRDRARSLGGSHAAAHLCVFHTRAPEEASDLKRQGNAVQVQVHVGAEIQQFFSQ